MKASKHYKNRRFRNLVSTSLSPGDNKGIGNILRERRKTGKKRFPQKPIKTNKFDKKKFISMNEAYVWFGHSTLLMRVNGKTIVSDPVFGRASPFRFIGPSPFPMTRPPRIEDLPKKIDLLLISHNHYDHLENKTIKKISKNVGMFFVPLKLKKLLVKWGVSEEKIREFDWYDSREFFSAEITFSPSRHFSSRGIRDRNSTLWGGWIIKSPSASIFISGDTGYFDEFKKIGKNYGPFDIAFIENGQYNEAWSDIHMMPEESVQAGIDLKSKILFPFHWGKYDLSIHSWKEPIERFTNEAKKRKKSVATPMIGEIFNLNKIPSNKWWKKH